MRVSYVTRSFLDYRIPVFAELDRQLSGKLRVIYNVDYVPDRVHGKIKDVLGDRAIGMSGEKRIEPNQFPGFANAAIRIVYQPGLLKEIYKTKPQVLIVDGFSQWTYAALLHKAREKRRWLSVMSGPFTPNDMLSGIGPPTVALLSSILMPHPAKAASVRRITNGWECRNQK